MTETEVQELGRLMAIRYFEGMAPRMVDHPVVVEEFTGKAASWGQVLWDAEAAAFRVFLDAELTPNQTMRVLFHELAHIVHRDVNPRGGWDAEGLELQREILAGIAPAVALEQDAQGRKQKQAAPTYAAFEKAADALSEALTQAHWPVVSDLWQEITKKLED